MTEALTRSITVDCPLEHAFDVFTGKIDLWWPRGHRKFERSTLTLEPRAGGLILERMHDGQEAVLGTVIDCDPPHTIRYSWNPGKITEPTVVAIRFERVAEGTRVDVEHRAAANAVPGEWGQRVALFEKGWGTILPAFKDFAAPSDKGRSNP
jgi:uncharacterized protein YndB with AHSA1/START domain